MGETTPAVGCVLFADVSGSTKLYETVGDDAAHQAIDLCIRLFSALTVQHGGRVVKTIGDEVMAIFPDAAKAGAAARDIQLGMNDMAPVGKVRPACASACTRGRSWKKPVTSRRHGESRRAHRDGLARADHHVARDRGKLTAIQKMDCRQLYTIREGKDKEIPSAK